jgi:lysozyme family protein
MLYLFAVTRYEDKQISNSSHVRWSILPILAFVILRNINPTLQRHFNIPFWFIGRITLELSSAAIHSTTVVISCRPFSTCSCFSVNTTYG